MKKIISFILVLATVLGCMAMLPFGAWAEGLASGDTLTTLKPIKASTIAEEYLTQSYASAQDKLDRDENMVLMASYGEMELYANVYTGEVYIKNTKTGEIMHSNPYNMLNGDKKGDKTYMAQLLLRYKVTETDSDGKEFNSFSDSAMHGQITIDSIANGVRVNYALGDTTKRYLLPYGIMANEMIEMLFAPMQKEIVEQLQEIVTEAGLEQEYITKYFDFERFCSTSSGKTYSTLKKLGVEYTYGNIDAFEVWFNNAVNFYEQFYTYEDYAVYDKGEDPVIERDDTSNFIDLRKIKEIALDYQTIEAYYSFESPYLETKGDDPDQWTVIKGMLEGAKDEDKAKVRSVFWNKTPHPVYGKDYYNCSIFVLDQSQPANKLRDVEALFGRYVDGYTLTKANKSEDETGVYPLVKDKPVFYVSIEYKLTEDGFTAEVPASSIMYDESVYTVEYIEILSYMGTADVGEDGYIFFPDGSGTIIDFDEFRDDKSKTISVEGKFYGEDYAKYVIKGLYQKNISMPVYGISREASLYTVDTPYGTFYCSQQDYLNKNFEIKYECDKTTNTIYAVLPFNVKVPTTALYELDPETDNQYYSADTKLLSTNDKDTYYYGNVTTKLREKDFKIKSRQDTGFLAIVEEGASLMSILCNFQGDSSWMTKTGLRFAPRVEDKYVLDNNDKVSTQEFPVQAKNKYMGSYTVRFVMLTDPSVAEAAGVTEYYEPTYVGMAAAYQNYLLRNNLLPASADINDQLPLIIETFGVMQTQKKFLSIPFTVDVALTTFDDIELMYEELAARGIKNVKFRLTGFTNGGMNNTYPVKLKWEKEAGGKSGFKDLLEYAADETRSADGLEIYPNFNFMYLRMTATGDGVSLKKIGAKCADNRYATRATYSSIYQEYIFAATDGILVTPAKFAELFAKFNKKYSKYDIENISLAAIGNDLSGDFDNKDGITREESLNYITDLLETVTGSCSYNVMTNGGNLYALKYMKYLIDAPLDSSHFKFTSRTVPFWGMVVHGHVQYAGEAFNEQANKDEAMLRAIESGANLYFILSYENTQLMKDDIVLSNYYSVDYQISKNTVEEYYKKLNAAIGDLQSYHIINHETLNAERVISDEDYALQLAELEDEFLAKLDEQTKQTLENYRHMILAFRDFGINANELISIYDADGDGFLTGAEQDAVWNSFNDAERKQFYTIVKTYQYVPVISEIIGGVNLDIDDHAERLQALETVGKQVLVAILNDTLNLDLGRTIGVAFNEAEVIASAYRQLDVETLRDEFVAEIRAYMTEMGAANNATDIVVNVGEIIYTPAHSYFTTSAAQDQDYKATESTIGNGTVVMVTYSNGTDTVRIVLNYNVYAVNIRLGNGEGTVRLEKYGYLRLDD